MRSRSLKDSVLLFFKPYVVFVLLVILNKWLRRGLWSLELGFRQCHLVMEVAFEVQVDLPRFGMGGGSKVCGERLFLHAYIFP